jgi:hypothetical protein
MLKDKAPDIMEEFVLQNTPADIDILECLATLGFISPSKVKLAKTIQDKVTAKLTIDESSQP